MFSGLEYTLLCREDVFITNLLLLRALCVIIEGMQIRLGIDKRPRHFKSRSKSRGRVVSNHREGTTRPHKGVSQMIGKTIIARPLVR